MLAVNSGKEIMSCGDAKHLKSISVHSLAIAGWMNQKQQYAIDYLREENRVLREQLGNHRLRFTNAHAVAWQQKPNWLAVDCSVTLPALLRRTHCSPGTANSLRRRITAV